MAPAPKEHAQKAAPGKSAMDPVSEDEVVISGVSGLLPNCDSFLEFSEKLYNKENMVTKHNARWKELRHPELSPYAGMVRGLAEFDAQFFTVFYTLAHSCEPVARLLFEQTYQAVFDAGICPSDIYGQRIGVFMAASLSESEKMCSIASVPLGIIGVSRTMFANRISYWLNLKGPSMTIDGDACGTIVALENAYHAMMSGYCDAAIVGSGKLILHPQTPIIYNRSSPLNPDGKTKCYDTAADGQSLSEAINVFFLQKYKDAKRVYAMVKHAKAAFGASSNREYSEQVKMPRDATMLSNFYRDFYDEAGVSPSAVEYVEGFGAANPELDKLELQAIERVFCKDRRNPLLVGSVASNIGFTEASAASCSIFKLLLAYQRGELAANLHCENPRQDVNALRDGRMRIVTDHTRFGHSYAAVNALSITGINAHALLQGFGKAKDWSKYQSTIPYLVMASGRQESAVQKILDDFGSRRLDPEEIALIHNIYKTRISKHLSRGYAIYSTKEDKTMTHNQKVDYYDDAKRPLWFVYSGMGSQWVGMGVQLMRIPIFAASIARCQRVLDSKGIDLVKIITSEDKSTFDNILHSFVGISAIQVALTDLLTAIGLVPDKIIGHSLGEAGCAYADGCFSTEEVMMLSYIRGLVSISTKLTRGAMAAIGLGSKQISKICPPDIDVACHNNSTSSTISGPIEAVQKFVEQLTAQGVFAKEVQCSNIAYHSRYVAKLGPDFLRMAKDVVKIPKTRSSRWISSSIPAEKWDDPVANLSSAEYHTNNLLNSVLFEEALRFVPSNAVLVEIAPHGLLQAILKRAVSGDCRTIPLTRRGHPDNALFFLEAIGNLYMQGYDPNISALYPKIEFPVSSSTRPLSHLVEWVHAEKWKLCRYINPARASCAVFKQIVTVADDEFQYLKGHHIEGIRVLPFAACLVAVWDTLAMTLGKERRKVSVQFIDVKFHSQPPMFDDQLHRIVTTVHRGCGQFEVYDGKVVIVEGVISVTALRSNPVPQTDEDPTMYLSKEDIYKLFYERGYEYKDKFRSIYSMNASMTEAEIQWEDNWVTFLDGILQMHALRCQHTGVAQPTHIKRLLIDVKENMTERIHYNGLLRASYDEIQNKTSCGGVTTEHVFLKNKPPAKRQSVELQTLKFVPFDCKEIADIGTAISITIQIVAENVNKNKITVFVVNVSNKSFFASHLKKIQQISPEIILDIVFMRKEDILQSKTVIGEPDVVFLYDLLSDKKIFEALHSAIPPNTFVSSVGVDTTNLYPTSIYNQVSAIGSGRARVELARFKPSPAASNTSAITVRSMSDLHQLRNICEQMPIEHKILVLAPHPVPANLKEQVKFWRRTYQNNISMAMFDQKNSMDKKMESIPDMAFSVLQDDNWGGDYYVPTRVEKAPANKVMSLICTSPGDLRSLGWVETKEPITKHGIEVTVHYSGLIVNDASRALAEIPVDSNAEGFGMDFSGVTASGERVMGLMQRGSAASKVRADPRMLWPVPKHWSLEDAATVPYAYCHALYLISKDVLIFPMTTVLVHGGAGALGQALITLLLARGCRVFVTVSDVRKKHFLRKLFPDLRDEDIGNSRDDSFKDMIMRATNGEGVFQIFGCVKGDLRNPSIACCSMNGCIKDTTQIGTTRDDFDFGLKHLNQLQHYYATDFSSIFTNSNHDIELRKLQLVLSDLIIKGVVRPLSRVTYTPHEVPRAFRLLAASRHRGRVLLAMRETTPVPLPEVSCQPSDSYLVLYDEENFGLRVADMLVKRGAKKIYLHAIKTSYLKYKLQSWEELGVNVEVLSTALSKREDILTLLKNAKSLGDLRGIYFVATSVKPKPEYTSSVLSYLDSASRKICPNLCHFAVISEDDKPWRGIINERVRNGLPALSLRLAKLERFDSSGSANNEAKSSNTRMLPHTAIQAVEEALYSGDHVVHADVQPILPRTILEEVAQIPGVNITNATVDRTTLEMVGVDHGRVRELCILLDEKFNITISPDAVPKMTIGQLKQLKKPILDVEAEVSGFGAYISTVDQDEMLATNELMLMPTLVHNSELRADEFDIEHDYLCIIPGLEGHHARFSSLCERLKLPAVVLQLGHNHLQDSIQEMAQRCADTIMKHLKPKKKFYVLGYEFGVLVALEVAAVLERYGLTGTVYMLGGTPQDIRSSFAAHWKSSDVTLEDTLVQHLYHLITHSSSSQLDEDLRLSASWQEKVEALIRASRKKVTHSSQYIRGITEGIYARIKLLQNYNSQKLKLQSKIVLMQAKFHASSTQTVKSFTNQEVVVKDLAATLAFAHKDLSVPNIINTHMDSNILDEFSKSNQCITALINDDEYLKLQVVQDW